MSTDQLHAARLRRWARGAYDTEAATELLIRTGWADTGLPWIADGSIDFDAIVEHIGGYSGGEQRLLRIVASIAGHGVVNLNDAAGGLDRRTLNFVLAALAHLAGSHQHSTPIFGHTDTITGFANEPTLHPWPDA